VSSLVAAGTGAVDAVLLASAVVPPIVVIALCRIAWVWAKSHDEEPDGVPINEILRRAFWLRPRAAAAGSDAKNE
jgi:hypothetical protein